MSKSTPSSATEKTRLGSRALRYSLVTAAVVAISLPFFFQSRPTTTLQNEGRKYRLEIVTTAAAQEKGLGGRKNMATDHGMIFVFSKPATQCFWMKDMQFSLDMIWLDSTKRVTKVAANISPATYPEKYCSDVTTKYVIELNAGEAEKAGIGVGDTLRL